MEILAIIGGLVALIFVLKLLLFISNKLYLEKMLDSLRERGDFQAVAWFESVTSGERGQDMASAAWRAIIQFKSLGIDPATAAPIQPSGVIKCSGISVRAAAGL